MAKPKDKANKGMVTITAGTVAAADATIQEVKDAIRVYRQAAKDIPNGWEPCGLAYRTTDGLVHVRLHRSTDDESPAQAVALVSPLATEQQCRQITAIVAALQD